MKRTVARLPVLSASVRGHSLWRNSQKGLIQSHATGLEAIARRMIGEDMYSEWRCGRFRHIVRRTIRTAICTEERSE
jgi:hypothetical protein